MRKSGTRKKIIYFGQMGSGMHIEKARRVGSLKLATYECGPNNKMVVENNSHTGEKHLNLIT